MYFPRSFPTSALCISPFLLFSARLLGPTIAQRHPPAHPLFFDLVSLPSPACSPSRLCPLFHCLDGLCSCILIPPGVLCRRGSDILREVAWVIFDEIHYMQDKERGVVWEETIIFLPPEAKMVLRRWEGGGGLCGLRAMGYRRGQKSSIGHIRQHEAEPIEVFLFVSHPVPLNPAPLSPGVLVCNAVQLCGVCGMDCQRTQAALPRCFNRLPPHSPAALRFPSRREGHAPGDHPPPPFSHFLSSFLAQPDLLNLQSLPSPPSSLPPSPTSLLPPTARLPPPRSPSIFRCFPCSPQCPGDVLPSRLSFIDFGGMKSPETLTAQIHCIHFDVQVLDDKNRFKEENWSKVVAALAPAAKEDNDESGGGGRGRGRGRGRAGRGGGRGGRGGDDKEERGNAVTRMLKASPSSLSGYPFLLHAP